MDRNMEKRVWNRVYGGSATPTLTPRRRQEVEKCLRREEANLHYYERQVNDPVFGQAFSRLASEAGEHCKMLRRMLEM